MEGGKKMKSYRVELVCESGANEPEEPTLRTSADVACVLRPYFVGIDREKSSSCC
jgi:hypothetical protein